MLDYKPSILLIARHFPPHVSGGARRPFLFSRSLRELGCNVSVVAPTLPDGVSGIIVPHKNPTPSMADAPEPRIKSFLRECLLWPDPDIGWANKVVETCDEQIDTRPDWILTTSPPESVHIAGLKLKKKYHCHWAADFRDLWLEYPLRPARNVPVRRFIEKNQAKKICRNANVLIGVSPEIQAEINQYSRLKNVELIPQASPNTNDKDFKFPTDKFNIVHTGSFSLSDLNRSLFRTLWFLEAARKSTPNLHLHLVGRLTKSELESLQNKEVMKYVSYHGIVSLQESWAMQNGADALLLVGDLEEKSRPGKLSEYVATGRPIIAIGDGPQSQVINENQKFTDRINYFSKKSVLGENKPSADIYTERQAARDILAKMYASIHS